MHCIPLHNEIFINSCGIRPTVSSTVPHIFHSLNPKETFVIFFYQIFRQELTCNHCACLRQQLQRLQQQLSIVSKGTDSKMETPRQRPLAGYVCPTHPTSVFDTGQMETSRLAHVGFLSTVIDRSITYTIVHNCGMLDSRSSTLCVHLTKKTIFDPPSPAKYDIWTWIHRSLNFPGHK